MHFSRVIGFEYLGGLVPHGAGEIVNVLPDSGDWNIRFDMNRPSSGMVFLLGNDAAGGTLKSSYEKTGNAVLGFAR